MLVVEDDFLGRVVHLDFLMVDLASGVVENSFDWFAGRRVLLLVLESGGCLVENFSG